jgi:hypothetical protein
MQYIVFLVFPVGKVIMIKIQKSNSFKIGYFDVCV